MDYNKILELADKISIELESYNDYPQAATNNAKRAIKYKEENGSDCGTRVGWTRAGQLARRENISRDTIARMASFKRHQQNKDVPYSEGCGGLMWDAWGGSSGINWAISKLKQIDKKENFRRIIDFKNNGGWIHISQLKKNNSVIATKDKILFKNPTSFAKPIALIKEGRLLILEKCEQEWCQITSGKFQGWVKTDNIWGFN